MGGPIREVDQVWDGRCKSIRTMGSQHHIVLVRQNCEPFRTNIG